jgi:hypothetical protein
MNAFASIRSPRSVALTSPQVALILALERVLQAAGLWLVCDHCARTEGSYGHLQTDNAPEDAVWRMDCSCTTRRFERVQLEHTMAPSGDLLKLAETLLAGTGLVIRCPVKKTGCLTTPLEVTLEPDGTTARCQCWQIDLSAGVYRFRKQAAVPA